MKIRYFVIGVLGSLAFTCNAESISNSENKMTNNHVNHQQSKLLIERFNKIRQRNNMNNIVQDTPLDNICNTIISNKNYRNIDNTFNEDSIRYLFYNNGVLDYQYEINEVLDKDTTDLFKSILLTSNSNRIRMGYTKSANKHLFVKTIHHDIQFCSWRVRAHSAVIDGFSNSPAAPMKTDTILCKEKNIDQVKANNIKKSNTPSIINNTQAPIVKDIYAADNKKITIVNIMNFDPGLKYSIRKIKDKVEITALKYGTI